jgi:hypothetical protein
MFTKHVQGHAVWTYTNETWKCSSAMQHEQAAWTCRTDLEHAHAVLACRMNTVNDHISDTASNFGQIG